MSQRNVPAGGTWTEKWALVTGASAGIGVALAEELAMGRANLVLTARRKDRLEMLAQRLASTYKVQTEVFPADLADSTAPEKIFAFTRDKGIEIDLLINNICSSTTPASANTANSTLLTGSAFSRWFR